MVWPVSSVNGKTEVIHFYSRYMPSDSISHLRVGTAIIEPVKEVRDLGISLDSTVTLRTHINNICRSGSLSLHELSKTRKYIFQKDTERVVHAFISSKLDYCNGLFYGLPSSEIQKLQKLQNSRPRLVLATHNYFEFWLVYWIVFVLFWLTKVITLVLVLRHSTETRSNNLHCVQTCYHFLCLLQGISGEDGGNGERGLVGDTVSVQWDTPEAHLWAAHVTITWFSSRSWKQPEVRWFAE